MKELVLISQAGAPHQEPRILALAAWMGVPTRQIIIGNGSASAQLIAGIGDGSCSVVVSTGTLAVLREASPPGVLEDLIERHCAHLLVFSVGDGEEHADLLSWLTGGAVAGLGSAEERRSFCFPEDGRRFSRPFGRQSFSLGRPVPVSAFNLTNAESGDVDQILRADDHPVFLRLQRGSCELFLLALGQLPDIEGELSPNRGVEEYYDQLIPLLIFLRHCFGDMCWHGAESTARLIIDDPLLVPFYGFLSYGALRESMRSAGYAASIAFIPWNHWRTSKGKATAILADDPNLAICVHGCDHTNREFGDVDPESLQWKADTALSRMGRHRRRTGLAFDPVMVFPQGKFSSPAMLALRTGGYLAAVNTTCFPTDAGAPPLTIADFLRPAITKFDGFPLFQRRYPRRLIDFAFDIFLGRPVLLVQHHDDFRDGYRRLEEFVSGLHELEPKLAWAPLSAQLMASCVMRSLSATSMEVRFFTRQFRFKNARSTGTALVFSKAEPDAAAISGVLVDGVEVPFSFEHGVLAFEHHADAGQVIDVTILDRPRLPAAAPKPFGITHTMRVGLRRALSEFRDHALRKHPGLLAAASWMATRMRVTGDDGKEERI